MGSVKRNFLGGAEREAGRRSERASRRAAGLSREQREAAERRFQPFIEQGTQAFGVQAAQSGALGAERQREAFQQFTESPGQAFLREQGLRGIEGEAAITGGLGSGERLRELVRFSQGLAQQDFGAQFNRLGAVAGAGLTSATNLSNVAAGLAGTQGQALQAGAAARGRGEIAGAAQIRERAEEAAQAAGSSDIRLKENIKYKGTENGHRTYTWTWNSSANAMGLFGQSFGVIANEVEKTNPEAVIEIDGYKHVYYEMIGVDHG